LRLQGGLMILALGLASWAPAAPSAAPTPLAPAAPVVVQNTGVVAVPVLTALKLTLKDGQSAKLWLRSYDDLCLDAVNARGLVVKVPWREVQSLKADGMSADAALMQQYIHPDEPVEVSSLIGYRDPDAAFNAALWPGVALHGWGHRAGGDPDTFYNLAGGEFFSLVLMGFGLPEALGPDPNNETKSTSQAVSIAGGLIFVGTWVSDLWGASAAARQFNEKNGLALAPRGNGVELALRF
jgi:hypothetical protein